MDQQHNEQAARERVQQLKGFYTHLVTFVVVNVILFIIDAIYSHDWWFYWVTFIWGIVLVVKAFKVFGTQKVLDKKWEDKQVNRMMDDDDKKE